MNLYQFCIYIMQNMHNINIRMILLFKNIRYTFLHVYYVTEEGTAYVNVHVCPTV